MNQQQSSANAGAGAPTVQLRNYDVLLLPSSTDPTAPLRFAPGNDVGNCRFCVLLSLSRRRYLDARANGDEEECTSIAEEVLATVCDRCIPNGRFFVQHDGGWRQFEREGPATVMMVRRALETEPIESSPPAPRDGERVCKRPSRFLEMLCRAAEAKAPLVDAREELISKPGPFDVVCDAEGKRLAKERRHTGNNRLKILLAIRMRRYTLASDRRGKHQLAEEVVGSILDDASGRYLRPDPSGKYEIISRDIAIACTKRAFDAAARKAGRKRKRKDYSEAKKIVQRKNKRAILDRAEKLNKEGGNKGLGLFATGAVVPSEAFSSVVTHREVVPKAA